MANYEEQIPIEGLRRMTVHLQRGDVRIERIEGSAILVHGEGSLHIDRQDDHLRIRAVPGGHSEKARPKFHLGTDPTKFDLHFGDLELHVNELVSGVNEMVSGVMEGLFGGDWHGDLRIGVPGSLELPTIVVETHSGDLTAQQLTARWRLHSGAGDLLVQDCGGALDIQSGRGDVRIERFAGPVEAQVGAGDLSATDIEGPLALHSGHGDIRLTTCPAGGDVHSGAGDVIGEGLGGDWQVRTGHGDIRVRAQDGASLHIHTGAGDVTVKGGPLTSLQVQAAAGDVQSAVVLAGPRHIIATGSGDITLALAEKPGARLQILTGHHGDVSSVYPLVRVGKQGPPSHGGARYVGNVGNSEIDVELRTQGGDVTIRRLEATPTSSVGSANEKPEHTTDAPPRATDWTPMAPTNPVPPIPSTPPFPPMAPSMPLAPVHSSADPVWDDAAEFTTPAANDAQHAVVETVLREPVAVQSVASPGSAATSGATGAATSRDVLHSLQRGEISVEEAGVLLEALFRRSA